MASFRFFVKDILNNKNLYQTFVRTIFFGFSSRHLDYKGNRPLIKVLFYFILLIKFIPNGKFLSKSEHKYRLSLIS